MRKIIILLLAVIVFVPLASARRNSTSVRKEKQENVRKMERTRRQIDDNNAQTARELRNLQSIEGRMVTKRKQAERLRRYAENTRLAAEELADSIKLNTANLESLRKSYAASLRAIRGQRHVSSSVAYVLSAESFSQAHSRVRYLQELAKWEQEKAASISVATQRLKRQHRAVDSLHNVLRTNLDSLASAEEELRIQQHQASAVVSSLKRQSKNLRSVLREQERLARKLDDELNRIIEEEQRKQQEKPERKNEPRPKDNKLTGSFASNKGRLPLPVDREATVVSTFGRHSHQELEKVQTQNNGIDFETVKGAQAVAVYPGVVSMVIVMEGFQNVVIVRHGEYLTVYAGIGTLKVRKGQNVEAGQPLGTIASDNSDGDRTRLHFEVRHEKQKLNPADWLR